MTEQNINITLDRSGPDNHGWTVLGTLLACGAVGMLAWSISAAGMLDLAATGLSFFFVQLISMMFKSGLIVLPKTEPGDFAQTSGTLRTAWREFQEFQVRSPIWRMALLALSFTIAYMLFRLALSFALGIFSNIWIAGAAAAFVASLIVAPQLFSSMFSKFRTRSRITVHRQSETPAPKSETREAP